MKSLVRDIKICRICRSKKLFKFLDLGEMPIPNGFLNKEQVKLKEDKFELACFVCDNCGLVQLTKVVDPILMFGNYAYFSAMSNVMMNNFSNLSHGAHKDLKLSNKSLVVDIGSNDGSLLAFFKNYGTRVLGIDPAKNIAKVARMRGIPTESVLFNTKNAKKISKKHGRADLMCATNVIAHIDNLHETMKGVDYMLTADGAFITEFPYLFDLVNKFEFDTIYHEHLSYFSIKAWLDLVERYGFEIVDIQRLLIHGGSLRITHRRKGRTQKKSQKTLRYLLALENESNLHSFDKLSGFANQIKTIKSELVDLLKNLKKSNKKVVGYGAAAKGNVLTNYFGINKGLLSYIVDSTPFKQGLYTPGMHIPIVGEMQFRNDKVDYALILAWNFADEIIAKEKIYRKSGGKFIIPIPKTKII